MKLEIGRIVYNKKQKIIAMYYGILTERNSQKSSRFYQTLFLNQTQKN